MMANNIIINQALDALRASLPMGDVVSTTAVKVNCTNENDVTVKIMNVDFVCHVRENITKATLNPTLATMQTMNNDKQQILLVTQYVTPQVSTELANRGINYLDCAGNCLVRYTKAGNLIFQIFNQGRKNTESKVKTYPVFSRCRIEGRVLSVARCRQYKEALSRDKRANWCIFGKREKRFG